MHRTKWLQVRVTPEEHEQATKIAREYGMSMGMFVRTIITYLDNQHPRPTLTDTITIAPVETDNGTRTDAEQNHSPGPTA